MATTPKGITYPAGGDAVTPLQSVFSTLASSVDTVLTSYVGTADKAVAADITAGTSAVKVATAKSLKDAGVQVGDTGWVNVSSTVSAGTGFTKGASFSCYVRKVGATCYVRVSDVRKAASNPLPVSVSGNITNTVIVSGIPAEYRPSMSAGLSAYSGGRANAYLIDTAGNVSVTAMIPAANQTGTVNVPTNEGFSCAGMYFV